ncbi:hypothetical protein SK128_003592 [Halocaridina rubra]|uniref:C2H2-type domain-containing protein n=1 Tax=Halocaridina rubra TaxID=373956 RepID=A0AAN8XN54_HALRR
MSNYYQRNRNQNRQQMVNPWQNPMAQLMAGGGMQTGSNQAALAFSILNQVLSTNTPSPGMSRGVQDLRRDLQNRRNRTGIGNRLDDRRRKSPQSSNRNSDRGSRHMSSRSRSPHRGGRSGSTSRRDGSDYKRNLSDRLGRSSSQGRRDSDARKSKSKDRDQEADKSGRDRDSKASPDKDKRDPLKEKENEEATVKCLKCHICEVDSFDSIESFRNHKKSEDHRLLMNIFNARSEAVLQVLRADAKLAANREKEKTGNANKETFYGRCVRCNIDVADAFKSHKKSIEHELVDNYLSRECCGSSFAKRKEFEEHRLTIPHLKRYVEPSSKENEPGKEVVLAYTDEEEKASDTLRDLKETHQMKLESPADFPDYDATEPIGLSYIHKKRRFTCTVCRKSFPSYNTMALAHCRSFNHYLMLLNHLEPMLKEVEDEEEVADGEDIEDSSNKEGQESTELGVDGENDGENQDGTSEHDDEIDEEEEQIEKVGDGNEVENENENIDGEEDMGEAMPILEDGGILLEESDKYVEENDVNTQEEDEDTIAADNVKTLVESTVEKDQEERLPEEVMEVEEEKKTEDNEQKNEEAQAAEEESEEEPEPEPEPKVKPKAPRGRRGRGRGRARLRR